METRKAKKPLDHFKSGRVPIGYEVVRRYVAILKAMDKQNGDYAALKTADALIAFWAPTGLPLATRGSVKGFVKGLHKRKNNLLVELNQSFDISAKDAMEIIAADKTLLPIDREEDQSFLLAIRENRQHCLGSLDAKRIRRLKRSAEREQKFANQVGKESKWQKLDEVVPSDDLEKYLPPSQSLPQLNPRPHLLRLSI
ncbi:Hypothetical protein FKW44_021464 [Caligus rogercresseyi]|uniref:Uncharacterized protein n=1 Tax=Caligus rogercresseyi TaxID=217165 RepID=A0A7T8JVU4_CALRO|nr:Hypothetical protein FKW44_021464 [Caligus rogercresseyi]